MRFCSRLIKKDKSCQVFQRWFRRSFRVDCKAQTPPCWSVNKAFFIILLLGKEPNKELKQCIAGIELHMYIVLSDCCRLVLRVCIMSY